jgi:YcxB-like protein
MVRPLAHSIGMEVTYELKQRDFFDSLIAHRNRSAFVKWAYRLIVAIVFIFAGGGFVLLAVRPSSQLLSNLVPAFALAVIWGALMWASPWWAARNQFSKQPAAQGARTMLVDSSGVRWQWNGGSANIEWKNFTQFQETKNQFMLYSSPVCFNIVPKRALTVDQMVDFRKLVAENLLLGTASESRDKKISPQTWAFLGVVIVAVVLFVMAIRNIH